MPKALICGRINDPPGQEMRTSHPFFAPSKKSFKASVLICFALAFIFTCCEDQWGNDARMGYVVEIDDDGSGRCTYTFAPSPDDKTGDFKMVTSCGAYKLREGIFIPK